MKNFVINFNGETIDNSTEIIVTATNIGEAISNLYNKYGIVKIHHAQEII